MIKITSKVVIYEIDGKNYNKYSDEPDYVEVTVSSHRNYDDRVILTYAGHETVTVLGRDLINAVSNAMRTK